MVMVSGVVLVVMVATHSLSLSLALATALHCMHHSFIKQSKSKQKT
jgi:hypothetical protein